MHLDFDVKNIQKENDISFRFILNKNFENCFSVDDSSEKRSDKIIEFNFMGWAAYDRFMVQFLLDLSCYFKEVKFLFRALSNQEEIIKFYDNVDYRKAPFLIGRDKGEVQVLHEGIADKEKLERIISYFIEVGNGTN